VTSPASTKTVSSRVLERKKDMIIHSGLKCIRAKVERVLGETIARWPGGRLSVNFGARPTPLHTEEVTACRRAVRPSRHDQSNVAGASHAMREHLGAYEVAGAVRFIEADPANILAGAEEGAARTATNPDPTAATGTQPTSEGASNGRVEHDIRVVQWRWRAAAGWRSSPDAAPVRQMGGPPARHARSRSSKTTFQNA